MPSFLARTADAVQMPGPGNSEESQQARQARLVQEVELLIKIQSVKNQRQDIERHTQLLQQANIGLRFMIQELQKQVQEKEAAGKAQASQQQTAAQAATTEHE